MALQEFSQLSLIDCISILFKLQKRELMIPSTFLCQIQIQNSDKTAEFLI